MSKGTQDDAPQLGSWSRVRSSTIQLLSPRECDDQVAVSESCYNTSAVWEKRIQESEDRLVRCPHGTETRNLEKRHLEEHSALTTMSLVSHASAYMSCSCPTDFLSHRFIRDTLLTCYSSRTRIRKVKCDETKPFCSRCTKTGRKCDGYLDPRALTKRHRLKGTAHHDHVLGPLLDFSAPEEKRAFYFFQQVTAPCISGDFDAAFWRVTVLQICQTEPAVRHAVLAVSSLHEGLGTGTIMPFRDGRLGQSMQSFALQQYNRAITRLLDQMNNPLTKPLASLLTCVLFVCIEYMQGKDKESLIHLEQGRQLLARLDQRSSEPEMDCIVRHIVPLYTRLSLTSFLFGGSPIPIPDSLKSLMEIPDTFQSMDNLRHCMHEFMEQAFRFTQRARPVKSKSDSISRETMRLLEVEQDRLLSRQAKLNVAFSLFRASTSKPMQTHTHALLVLEMYLHAQHIWISTALSSSEVVYDDFLASFAAIIPLAATYLDLEPHQLFRPQKPMPPPEFSHLHAETELLSLAYTSNFSFETHIIPPLYYVATKCRHPLIRRSALELLRRNPFRRENLWRASVMGALAGHIVALEEQWSQGRGSLAVAAPVLSACHFMPSSRVHHAHIQPHDAGGGFGISKTGSEQAIIASTAVPTTIPALSFEVPKPSVDPCRPMDYEASSHLSHAPSLAVSVDDGHSSSSAAMEPRMSFLSPPSHSETWIWQQQQQHQQQHHHHHQPPQMPFSSSVPYDTIRAQTQQPRSLAEHTGMIADYSSHSGSSETSSVDVEDQHHYQMLSHDRTPQQQHQRRATSVPATQQERGNDALCNSVPSDLITEAPFGLPEELRVHDAIIGPEREDGSWVAVFRKLHGVDADWDVQQDWVPTF